MQEFVNRYKMFEYICKLQIESTETQLLFHYSRSAVSMNIRICAAVIPAAKHYLFTPLQQSFDIYNYLRINLYNSLEF